MPLPSEKSHWLVGWFILGCAVVLIILLLLNGDANGANGGKAVLIIKKCGEELCADPMLAPRLVLKLTQGERPIAGQVIRCGVMQKRLLCEHGVEVEVESIMLQAVE